ncbi:hypothetical protein H4219_006033 [Mycoemilia scoparia]|uniref:Uncharacterized protein n=1 Tax=Mycoemilia scoparia TaxID=417184 RepID=A0A9W8DNT0_9FUNG|nr:hypothetical protein H4219_006033 [Mycoemilia scoparia]
MSSLSNPQAFKNSQEKLSPCSTMIHPNQSKTEVTQLGSNTSMDVHTSGEENTTSGIAHINGHSQHCENERKVVKKVQFANPVSTCFDDDSNAPNIKDCDANFKICGPPKIFYINSDDSSSEDDSSDEDDPSTFNQKSNVGFYRLGSNTSGILHSSEEESGVIDDGQKDKVELIKYSYTSSFSSSNHDHQDYRTLHTIPEKEEPSDSDQDLDSNTNDLLDPQISSARPDKGKSRAL